MKDLFPGRLWALENSNIEHDKNGNEQKLRSPISIEEQILMTPMEKEIEEYLYHDKETLSSWVAIVIRRALMLAKCQWQHGLDRSSELQSPPPSPQCGCTAPRPLAAPPTGAAARLTALLHTPWQGYYSGKSGNFA